jgi:hypothetical protein
MVGLCGNPCLAQEAIKSPAQPAVSPPATAPSINAPDEKERELAWRMQDAVLRKQDLNEIRQILKEGFKIDSPIGCGTFNCVDGAVAVHNVKMLKFFLDSGAKAKGSGLFQAVWCKDTKISAEMVAMLLKAGADPNYRSQELAPIDSACYLGNVAVVRLLLDRPGIELNRLNGDHRTPLMEAAAKGDETIARLLLEKGADTSVLAPPNPNHPSNVIPHSRTAVDFARNESIRELIANYKAPPAVAVVNSSPSPK